MATYQRHQESMYQAPTKCTFTLREKTCLKRLAVRIRLRSGWEPDLVDDSAMGCNREVDLKSSVLADDERRSDAADERSPGPGGSLWGSAYH